VLARSVHPGTARRGRAGDWRDTMRNYGIIGTLVVIILIVVLLRLLGVF
jgi:hypothetical protein